MTGQVAKRTWYGLDGIPRSPDRHVKGGCVTTLGLHSPILQPVRELRTKAGRREQGRFAIEGPTLLAEALRAGLRPLAVYVTAAGHAALAASAAGHSAPAAQRAGEGAILASAGLDDVLFVIPDRAMERLSDLESPPGILAVFPLRQAGLDEVLADGAPGIVLAGVSDPGNAGTLLRSAEIFGFSGAAFLGDAVEPYNPKVVRASMGAIFRLRLATATPAELVAAARRAGYSLVAAASDGEPLPEFRFAPRSLIAIGHERHGVTPYLPQVDHTVAIPQRGAGESLNAAVAGSIVFYAFSQRLGAEVAAPKTPRKA
jgi:TrmH family RNA methyltransferase